jgi:hypothetical protein
MPLHGVNNLGQHRDMTQRHLLTYVDEVSRNNGVASAGEITYDRNYAVDSKAVVNPLQFDSLVLTANAQTDRLGDRSSAAYYDRVQTTAILEFDRRRCHFNTRPTHRNNQSPR